MDEFKVLADICSPASQVMVHPHRDHQKVLVCVQVHPRDGVEIRVAEYYVALGSSQPGITIVISGDLGRVAWCETHCSILCKKAKPARRPRSMVRESTMTDRLSN
jgi:hypothetical protein